MHKTTKPCSLVTKQCQNNVLHWYDERNVCIASVTVGVSNMQVHIQVEEVKQVNQVKEPCLEAPPQQVTRSQEIGTGLVRKEIGSR
jgi:hypothetical protein